jgi:hypothetical protein
MRETVYIPEIDALRLKKAELKTFEVKLQKPKKK